MYGMAFYTKIEQWTEIEQGETYTVEFHIEGTTLEPSGYLIMPSQRESFIHAFRMNYHRVQFRRVLDVPVTLENLAAEFYFWGKRNGLQGLLKDVVVSDGGGVWCSFREDPPQFRTTDRV